MFANKYGYVLQLGFVPCPPPLHAERMWSAETCWTQNGVNGRRSLSPTSEEYQ